MRARLSAGLQNSAPCLRIQLVQMRIRRVEQAFVPCSIVRRFYCRRIRESPGEHVDKRLKSMMRELGDAINNSLSDSEQIADVISRIKAGGYDVFVVLEATIGFNQNSEGEEETVSAEAQRSSGEFQMTSQDLKFLKSLRISVGEDR